MPTVWQTGWTDRSVFERIEAGRYLGHTYNMPVFKIPASGGIPLSHADEPAAIDHHELFDIEKDPAQCSPIENPEVEARLCGRIAAHLQAAGAPAEQYERIGRKGARTAARYCPALKGPACPVKARDRS